MAARARDRAGEDLSRRRVRHHPGAHVHRDPSELLAEHLSLPYMAPRAQLQAEPPDLVRDRARASDRVDLIRECGEEAVARVVDLVPVIPLEALPDDGVVPGEQNAPTTFPKRRREPGRVDDVVNRTVARTCSRRRTSLECAPPVPGAQTDPSRGRGENGRDRSSTDRADSDFKDGTRHVIGG